MTHAILIICLIFGHLSAPVSKGDKDVLKAPLEERVAELEGRPETLRSLKEQALIYGLLGNLTERIDKLERASELAPGDPELLLELADAYRSGELYKRAIEVYWKLAEIDPQNAALYYGRIARIYARIGEEGKAAEAAEKAMKASPQSPEGYLTRASLALDWWEIEDAIKYLEKAAELRPDSVEIRDELGQAYSMAGKPLQAAEQYWKCFLFAEPDRKPAFIDRLVTIYGGICRINDLIDRLKKLAAEDGGDPIPFIRPAEV
ncbi:hypothetical protein DRP77_00885 [Candidatus Poribacteria bacterium]|nr:MAG: hypothetical protein DRP77_00885 [Candidatus Poribacteria bacterium]